MNESKEIMIPNYHILLIEIYYANAQVSNQQATLLMRGQLVKYTRKELFLRLLTLQSSMRMDYYPENSKVS